MPSRIIAEHQPASAEQIAAFEQKYRLTLAPDYREFLLRHNGGCPQPDACWIPDQEEFVLVSALYGLGRPEELDLAFWHAEFGDEMPADFVILGEDPGGAMFIFGPGEENTGVFFWDHQHNFADSSEDAGNTYFLAETFTAWLDSLRELPAK